MSKRLPVPGELFRSNGCDAFVIRSAKSVDGHPWVWYAPTLPQYPDDNEKWMIQQFIGAGIAVAGVDVGESYGNPEGTAHFSSFYSDMVEREFFRKPALLARSRGGLMLYNWAVGNAELVSCIAGIYPVCCLFSFPGIKDASAAYSVAAEGLGEHEPINRLGALAEAGVPIYHIHGDDDGVVPLEENSAALQERYQALGGNVTLTIAEGEGHSLWRGFFQDQKLVDFVIDNLRSNSD